MTDTIPHSIVYSESHKAFVCFDANKAGFGETKDLAYQDYLLNLRDDSPWHPIETAPKDGTTLDIMAKKWIPDGDKFCYYRFTDCYFVSKDKAQMINPNSKERWHGVEGGWLPIRWMPIPRMPQPACQDLSDG